MPTASAGFRALGCSKTLLQHVFVGMGAASFWRGAWYILDDHLFPDDPAKSAAASLGLGVAGMAASQGLVDKAERLARKGKKTATTQQIAVAPVSRHRLAITRFGALYTIAVSCVLVWRGTWVGWDCLYEYMHAEISDDNTMKRTTTKATDPGHATHSGLMSHIAAVSVLLTTGLFASVLAPPAAASVIRDLAVKTGGGFGQAYTGPAQTMANRIFGSGGGSAMASSAAATTRAMSSSSATVSAMTRTRTTASSSAAASSNNTTRGYRRSNF